MDYDKIKQIIADFEKSGLQTLEITVPDLTLKMSKPTSPQAVENSQPKAVSLSSLPKEEKNPYYPLLSPLVGTFYRGSSPTEKPFVEVGDRVKKGDVLCIIEAMKIMNEIVAPVSGVIVKIHAKNGEAVGFDQVLVSIDHAA